MNVQTNEALALIERFGLAHGGARGWKRQLARKARISPSHVSKILAGKPVGDEVLGRIRCAAPQHESDDDLVVAGLAIDAIRMGFFGLARRILDLSRNKR